MEEEAAKNPKDLTANTAFFDLDDAFSAVMGKDKNGQVRMYGTGITSTDVCGKKPSRATLIKENSEYKEKYQHTTEENITLRKEFEEFKAIVNSKLRGIGQPEIERAQVESPNVQHNSQSLPLTASNTQRSSKSASRQPVIRVGSNVVLKNFGDNEVVANGVISEMDNVRVNGMDLGPQFCSVII